ncbi:hypothetical protein Tco_0094459, partial [Tanacetum coccineum]
SAITELVYFIEPHNHLNPIFVSKNDCPWRVYDSEIMLELKSNGLPSRLTAVVRIFLSSGDRLWYILYHNTGSILGSG